MANIKTYADLGENIQDADKLPGTNDSDQTTTYNFSFTRIWAWIQTKINRDVVNVNAATYTLLSSDKILNVLYTSTGGVTITIPTDLITAELKGITVKDAGGNANTNNITIVGEGGELIDGQSSYIISFDYNAINIYSKSGLLYVY